MKLKNKLLPLVGIAATAAVVTPLVTSCKSAYDMIDITKGYTPKTKSSVAGELTQQEATKTFIDDVKKNPDIFKEDFIYGVYNKVIKTKNEFLNSPNIWGYGRSYPTSEYYELPGWVSAANFKLNSLKAGVSTPSFGTTEIAYPGEPKVTYPTVSFEYKIQIDYTYEYLGWMYDTGSDESFGPMSSEESQGYHARTIALETTVKYTNVPFLAVAHSDEVGKNTYWQVTPIDTTTIYAQESSYDYVHYYNQAYMFKYMTDDWSIDISASANVEHKQISQWGETRTTNSTPSYNLNINTWDMLKSAMGSNSSKKSPYKTKTVNGGDLKPGKIEEEIPVLSIGEVECYDLANYFDMMVGFINFGFESYYLSSVAQKPEVQASANMEGIITKSTTTTSTASFGEFYMPQSFDGDVAVYKELDATTGKPTGDIVLYNAELLTPMTLTIKEGTKLAQHGTDYQYGLANQEITWTEGAAPVSETYYNFYLPTTIVVEFTPKTGTPWTQVVYMNQNTLPLEYDPK